MNGLKDPEDEVLIWQFKLNLCCSTMEISKLERRGRPHTSSTSEQLISDFTQWMYQNMCAWTGLGSGKCH